MKLRFSLYISLLFLFNFSVLGFSQHAHPEHSKKEEKPAPKNSENQKDELICPVGKNKIEKGKEITFVYKNREFKVCCDGCIDEIKKNFSKYEKFGKKVKK